LVIKVVNRSTIHLDAHDDAKLLVAMSQEILKQLVKPKEEEKDEQTQVD
jgi:hypothetical protein